MKRDGGQKIVIFLVYFGGIAAFFYPDGWGMVAWLLGGALSYLFTYIDRLLYVYVTKPELHLSQAVRNLIKQKHYKAAFRLIKIRGHEQTKLMGKSVVFMAAFVPLGFYILSSTGSFTAAGLLLGIGLHLLMELFSGYKQREKLKQLVFWPIKRPVSDQEMYAVITIFALFFAGFTYAMIR